MVKLVALFKKPPNANSFEEHYQNVHIPLIKVMPGIKKIELSKITGAPMSQSQFYRMAEMYFENQQALNASMMSSEGITAAKDLMSFAKDVVQMFFAEVED
ncbi:MAG TPA: EthD family reductase [Candidatus Acidoferrales bacterium]|nr:EthD family reductase [Candidatus Acidoferrales bacterium]